MQGLFMIFFYICDMRPTDFKEEYIQQAYKLALLGAIDTEMADFFGVCEKTLNNWKHKHPEFLQSIKRGKVLADANVADRLYQRAVGFEHDSEEIKVLSDGKGPYIERVSTRKIYPPDPTSMIFWLKNRQPAKFRDKQEINHSGIPENKISVEIVKPTDDDD